MFGFVPKPTKLNPNLQDWYRQKMHGKPKEVGFGKKFVWRTYPKLKTVDV